MRIFAGKKAFVANELFTKIQRDLEVNTVTGIYATKHDWQKVILQDDLNAEQQVLLTGIFATNDLRTRSGREAIANELGLSYVRTSDPLLNRIQDEIVDTFVSFASKKEIWFQKWLKSPKGKDKNDFKELVTELKNTFLKNREIYQDLLKSRISRVQAIKRIEANNGLNLDDKIYIVDNNVGPGSNNNPNTGGGTTTKPPAPIAPNCMSKKPKNRSNKCKDNIQKYKAALKQYNKKYG